MKRSVLQQAQQRAAEYYKNAGIVLTEQEKKEIEVADFGLGRLEETGLQLVTYINTQRVCAKEMVLFPGQACPEHRHPATETGPGKEETFRCRWGEVFLYVVGDDSIPHPDCPQGVYTVFHEIVLKPGQQYTIFPNTLHWFRAGAQGAVISEFSTHSSDESDVFSDPAIQRIPTVED